MERFAKISEKGHTQFFFLTKCMHVCVFWGGGEEGGG